MALFSKALLIRILRRSLILSLIYCIASAGGALLAYPLEVIPHLLSSAEADAIIQTQEAAKQATKAAHSAELELATVKSEGRRVLANGQTVIIREVEPPANTGSVELLELAPRQAIAPTAEQIANFEAHAAHAQKEHHTLMLSATVYDHSVTRLSWRHENLDYIAYTSADFNMLRGTHSLTTETDSFTFFMGIGDASDTDNSYGDEVIPDASAFSRERSEYILVQGDPNNQEALASIDKLLEHYDSNLPRLRIEHQRRVALSEAQTRYNAQHANDAPEDFIMQFWVPEPTDRKVAE